ncbi:MAG: condensation domain-containing protein, partial [Bryobacteraceae bacterium]
MTPLVGDKPAIPALSAAARSILSSAAKGRGRFRLYPASFAQERLWLFDRMEPGNAVYNVPSALEITGDLGLDVLEQAMNQIVQRHEILRTTFILAGSDPMQVVWERMPVAFKVEDAPDENIQERITIEVRRPFSLESGPLLRVLVLRCPDKRHVLVLTMHHIVFDEWSRGIFLREIVAAYGSLLDGGTAHLDPVRIQYADYAVWQRKRLQ